MSSQMWLSQAEMWSYISPNPPRGSTRWGGACMYMYAPSLNFIFPEKPLTSLTSVNGLLMRFEYYVFLMCLENHGDICHI